MDLPTVSICIATHNRPEMLRQAVESVLAQTYAGVVEVCVYADGQWLAPGEDRRGNRHEVFLAGPERRGIAYAKNAALRLGTGQIRGILDDDDWYEAEFVERCVDAMQAQNAGFVYTDNWRMYPDGYRSLEVAHEPFLDAILTCRVRGDCWLARWDVLKQTKLHDERMRLEVDYDLFYQIAPLTRCVRVPSPLQFVRAHDDNTTKDPLAVAYWHAAGLAKYGYGIEWAERRARANPEWMQAVRDGYKHGEGLR